MSTGEKASCLRDGAQLANLLQEVKLASKEGEREPALISVEMIGDVVKQTNCVPEALKQKVKNELEALHNFVEMRDQEGVRQAVSALQTDLGAQPVREKLPAGTAGRKIKGYIVKVDGRPVTETSRKEAAQSFEALAAIHPTSKVELEPVY